MTVYPLDISTDTSDFRIYIFRIYMSLTLIVPYFKVPVAYLAYGIAKATFQKLFSFTLIDSPLKKKVFSDI